MTKAKHVLIDIRTARLDRKERTAYNVENKRYEFIELTEPYDGWLWSDKNLEHLLEEECFKKDGDGKAPPLTSDSLCDILKHASGW